VGVEAKRLTGKGRRWFAQIDLQEHEEKILIMLALVISAIVGLITVGFVAVTERLSSILITAAPSRRVLSPLLGSLIGGWLLYRFFPDARGSGIPQTRVALILNKGFISLRTVVGKFVCSALSLGSGVALGREGPSVHIGAAIASVIGRRLGLTTKQISALIPVGTAAAVAAAFNTPLAAVLFTLEEILADLHARLVGTVVIGAATSWIILRLLLGDEPLFHVPAYELVHPIEFLVYAVLGVIGGVASTAFVKLLLWQRAKFQKTPRNLAAFVPAAGGLTVGLLALLQPGVLGVGYSFVGDALNGRMELKIMLILLVLKIVATATCYGSGNAGGVFGPSLFIGAMLGGSVGSLAHTWLPDLTGGAGAYALVGMGAAFAGIVRTPMTSVIMIFEVTRDYTIIVPLMIANLCSYLVAKRLQQIPLYEALSRQDGILMPSPEHLPEPLSVDQAVVAEWSAGTSADIFVYPDDPLEAALQRMGATGRDEIAVLGRTQENPIGVLRFADAIEAYRKAAKETTPAPQNWVPAVAAGALAAVLIAFGLAFWQRTNQSSLAKEAYRNGEELRAKGQMEEAVSAFRNSLARAPEDLKVRRALGLALVESGHLKEAQPYLEEVAKRQPNDGATWNALASIAVDRGDKSEALQFYRQALARDWMREDEPAHQEARIRYAKLLNDEGRRDEAVSVLIAAIGGGGTDLMFGTRAAEMVKAIGSPEQADAAYFALANRYSDSATWMKLGDLRSEADDDTQALEAYRRAVQLDSGNAAASESMSRVEEVLRLDPSRRFLSARAQAERWDLILERILNSPETCISREGKASAKSALNRKFQNADTLEQKMEEAKGLWNSFSTACQSDAVLAQIFRKVGTASP
jgi:CIC family chloride channel protein